MEEQTPLYEEGKDWGWKRVSEFFGIKDPFFERLLFIEEYDISSNIYVIEGEYLSIIDPGNDYTAYIELFKRGYKPQDIRKVVLTHGHPEHIAGIYEFVRSYPNLIYEGILTVYLHEDGPEELKHILKDMKCKHYFVKPGEKLDLSGFELEVLFTPGHTLDSICLYHAPSKSVFTGDTVLPYAVASPDPMGGGRIDYHLFSLKILMNIDINHLFPGHGPPIANDAKKVFEGTYAGIIKRIVGLETPWVEGAKFLASKGYLEECIFCCDKDLKENPNNLLALSLKASCLSDLGRYEEAIDVFDKIIELQPKSTFAIIGKGYALMGMGKYDDAIKFFDRALELEKRATIASIYKGMALYLSGRVEEAVEIPEFREEFVTKFREELEKRKGGGNAENRES